jgi:hypothetical protein
MAHHNSNRDINMIIKRTLNIIEGCIALLALAALFFGVNYDSTFYPSAYGHHIITITTVILSMTYIVGGLIIRKLFLHKQRPSSYLFIFVLIPFGIYIIVSNAFAIIASHSRGTLITRTVHAVSHYKHYHRHGPNDYSLTVQANNGIHETIRAYNQTLLDINQGSKLTVTYRINSLGKEVISIEDHSMRELIKPKHFVLL